MFVTVIMKFCSIISQLLPIILFSYKELVLLINKNEMRIWFCFASTIPILSQQINAKFQINHFAKILQYLIKYIANFSKFQISSATHALCCMLNEL